jgi:hypothetical protein
MVNLDLSLMGVGIIDLLPFGLLLFVLELVYLIKQAAV